MRYPIICASMRLLVEHLNVFVRDMSLQHKEVRFRREGKTILCDDPQRTWVVIHSSRRSSP